jgi:hypothetical protein
MRGGEAPARMNAGSFTGSPKRIYTRVLLFVDPDWTNGGNTGTKFFFFSQQQGNNHYTGIFPGADNAAFLKPTVGLQQTSNRNIGTIGQGVASGQWLDIEYVFIANDAGEKNGITKVWVNGVLCIDADDVMFFKSGTSPGFASLFLDPTYGGGGAPPPRDVFFRIAGWYRESAQ